MLFFSYLWKHFRMIILFAAFVLIFTGIFSLYELPVEAVLYASGLCAGVGVVLFVLGYTQYVRRHRALQELKARICLSDEDMPIPVDRLERDYQESLHILWKDKRRIESDADAALANMTDYYTLWAHQIKTPISAIHLLLQSEEGGRNTLLAAELFKVEQYVEMALSYVRLDGGTDLILHTYSLDGIVRQAVRKYARLFILQKLTLDFRESGKSVLTDEKWLTFVVEQLLSNALKYTQKGKISIYCEGNDLIVEDTGIGIQPEDMPRVFDKGFTGYNGRTFKKSTGIGLYLCRRVLKKLGHGISVESEVGAGTRMRITFPERPRMVD